MLHRFVGTDDLAFQPQRLCAADTAFEFEQLLLARSHAQTANVIEQPQLAVQLHAVHAEFEHGLRCGELCDQPRRMGRLAAGDLAFFDKDHILAPIFRKVICNLRPKNSTAYDDYFCLRFHVYSM